MWHKLVLPGNPGTGGNGRPLWDAANRSAAGAGLLITAASLVGPEFVNDLPAIVAEAQRIYGSSIDNIDQFYKSILEEMQQRPTE
jgi:hypothetical protein